MRNEDSFRTSRNYTALKRTHKHSQKTPSFRTSRNYTALKHSASGTAGNVALERAEITQLSNKLLLVLSLVAALERAEITQLSN